MKVHVRDGVVFAAKSMSSSGDSWGVSSESAVAKSFIQRRTEADSNIMVFGQSSPTCKETKMETCVFSYVVSDDAFSKDVFAKDDFVPKVFALHNIVGFKLQKSEATRSGLGRNDS